MYQYYENSSEKHRVNMLKRYQKPVHIFTPSKIVMKLQITLALAAVCGANAGPIPESSPLDSFKSWFFDSVTIQPTELPPLDSFKSWFFDSVTNQPTTVSEAKEATNCEWGAWWLCPSEPDREPELTEIEKHEACDYTEELMSEVATLMHESKLPTSMTVKNGKCTESTRKLQNDLTHF